MQDEQQRRGDAVRALFAWYWSGIWNQPIDTVKEAASAYLGPVWQWIQVMRGRGPGWLSHDIERELRQAKRVGRRPRRSIRSAIAGPSMKTLLVLGSAFTVLVALSLGLHFADAQLPGLPRDGDRISVFTAMWQVQAGIAALALPVLLFVIERSRDERQAALHSAEVLGRESWSFPIIGLSFVVLARMGIDMTWFSGNQLVFVTDLFLFLLTLVGALFAYYQVLQLILSPPRLRDRSIELAKQKTRNVLMQSVKVRIGNNRLFQRLADFGVGWWPFGPTVRDEADYLVLDCPHSGYFVDLHLSKFELFVLRLPWLTQAARAASEPSQPTPSEEPPDRSVWLLHRYADRVTEGDLGFVRLRRASFSDFTDADKRVLEARLRSFVQLKESDDL